MKIAVFGSGFITPEIFIDEIDREVPGCEFVTGTLPWPGAPRGNDDEIQEYAGDFDEIVRIAGDAEALVTDLAPVNAKMLAQMSSLKFIGVARGGPVNINIAEATRRGVVVTNAPGRNGPAVAEFTVALVLDMVRRIGTGVENLRSGRWQGDLYSYETCGFEIAGSTIGIVGFGKVGRLVVDLFRAFGMNVLVYDPFVAAADVEKAGARLVGLDELLASSDFVSIHARLTPETRGMISAGELAGMKDGAYLINTARPGLIDYPAVAEALRRGKLAGVALDVYPSEPPRLTDPIFASDRVLALPHVGGATRESAKRGAHMVAEDLARFIRGEELLHRKN